ncbi:MAG: 3-methyl-2-oxobutanoate hydroxymethyltransferase [Armatimonadetes bacterium]|nr:3-methyl-2-oxobutanoate hydroxymethyltransferase [Armatimonadota bacterium]
MSTGSTKVEAVSAPKILGMKKKGEKIVCLTAYDYTSALIADRSNVDLILVGDSVGNVIQGLSTTLPVSLDAMVYHTQIASRGVARALLVADMPFGSYQVSVSQAVESAIRLMKAGAQAVKLEGAYVEQVQAIVAAGIPVMGHVGMTPQSVHQFGGFRVQGKGVKGEAVLKAAEALQQAGAFSVVLELIPSELSKTITEALEIPTIGIGAGNHCDGQVQVFHDLLGINEFHFKHVRRYAELGESMHIAISQYAQDVRSGAFPTEVESF